MYERIDKDIVMGVPVTTYYSSIKGQVIEVYNDPASEGLQVKVYKLRLVDEGGEELLSSLGV